MANLTTKELSALDDQITMEKMLVKKYQAMADLCADAQLQNGLNEIAQKHQRHCATLMNFLN
jgi:ferritin